jgi:hypothetical protein
MDKPSEAKDDSTEEQQQQWEETAGDDAAKGEATTTASTRNEKDLPPQQQQQQPGAYLIQGSSMERAGSGVASAVAAAASQDDDDEHTILAVAAELSIDIEAKMEEKVRARLLQETTQASVVVVEDQKENTSNTLNTHSYKQQYKKHRNVKEKLFGDARGLRPGIAAAPDRYIRTRTLLPWTIQPPTTSLTDSWVARVQVRAATDPRDIERSLRFYPTASESDAYQTGLAMAPPVRVQPCPPLCVLCHSQFAVFRRPSQCRNCGVCVCAPCSTQWSAKRLPETYYESSSSKPKQKVTICLACDWLANEFRQALLDGNASKAKDLHATGNVQLRTPYALGGLKGAPERMMHPIHMAITSGNMELVRWLVSECACPLTTNEFSNNKGGGAARRRRPLRTSNGRSPLQLALPHLEVLQFLVVEKELPLLDEEALDYSVVVAHLSLLLQTVSPKKLCRLSSMSSPNNNHHHFRKSSKVVVRTPSSSFATVPNEVERSPERSSPRRGSF